MIGKPAWNVPLEKAEEYIFGYTCGNDLSARDQPIFIQPMAGRKTLPGFAPAGPVIVTADSFDPDADNGIYCDVNGSRMQSDFTSV